MKSSQEKAQNKNCQTKETSKTKIRGPLFQTRESALTEVLETNLHVKSAYHLIASHFAIFSVTYFAQYILDFKELQEDVRFLHWAFSKWHIALSLELFFLSVSFLQWIIIRHKKSASLTLWIIELPLIAVYTLLPIYVCSLFQVTHFLVFAVAMEQIRIAMKMWSLMVENFGLPVGNRASFTQFLYFWFAPTFLYRHSYPRSKQRSWRTVFFYFLQFLCCVFVLFAVTRRFVERNLGNVVLQPIKLADLAMMLGSGAPIGSSLMFIGWYGILHCWLNLWAEALYFGDRLFYQFWWTSSSSSEYYRQWNRVVHLWLYSYIYLPMNKKFGSTAAVAGTIVFSSIFHEYILSMALGYFLPLLSLPFLSIGIWLYFSTKIYVGKYEPAMNIFIIASNIIAYTLFIFGFSIESYSRIYCPPVYQNAILDFFVPRSLSCIRLV